MSASAGWRTEAPPSPRPKRPKPSFSLARGAGTDLARPAAVVRSRTLAALALSVCALAACTAPPALGRAGADDEREADATPAATRAGDDASSETSSAGRFLDARRVALGEVGAGDVVTVEIGGDDVGFVVTASGPEDLGIERVTSPSGRVVFQGFTKAGTTQATGRAQSGTASVAVPSGPEATARIERGAWKVAFAGAGSATAHARVQVAKGAVFAGAVLDLHLWIPEGLRMSGPSPSHAVAATRAASDPDLRARVDGFFEALEAVTGIERGDVTFHAAPADLRTLEDEAKLARAGALPPAGESGQALHVVLTNDILNGAAMGLSPGMPGAVGLGGTAASAIFAAHFDDVDARTDALTWLHEMGHFVGPRRPPPPPPRARGRSLPPPPPPPARRGAAHGGDALPRRRQPHVHGLVPARPSPLALAARDLPRLTDHPREGAAGGLAVARSRLGGGAARQADLAVTSDREDRLEGPRVDGDHALVVGLQDLVEARLEVPCRDNARSLAHPEDQPRSSLVQRARKRPSDQRCGGLGPRVGWQQHVVPRPRVDEPVPERLALATSDVHESGRRGEPELFEGLRDPPAMVDMA